MKLAIPSLWNRDWAWGLLLLVATLFAYHPAWHGQPIWEDDVHLASPDLRSMNGLVRIWTQPSHTVQYFPLFRTVLWAESHLWGDSPLGHHVLNILLHVFSALILVRILRKLDIRAAWLAGGIFALHPVMVESVAWMTELKNMLSGAFFLCAALAYLGYTETGRRRVYVAALGLFVLGLLSKSGIAPFPLAMFAVVWWKRGRLLWRRDIVPLLPFFLASILLGLITIYIERTYMGTQAPEYDLTLVERCLIAGRDLWFYLGKLLLPVDLMICYPRWVVSAAVWWQYLYPTAALVAGGVLWAMRKHWRAPAAAFFYFTAMLLPYLGFFSLSSSRYSFVTDHHQYLAAIGPIVLTAVLLDRVVGLARVRAGVLMPAVTAILLLTLGMLSWKQSKMYANAETLYRTTIARNGTCWMAYNNLGLLLMNTGRRDEAMADFQKALDIHRHYAEPHDNLGLLLSDMGRTDEALAHFRKALEIRPDYGGAHFNLALLLAKMGRTDDAIIQYQKALEVNPNHARTHNNLALLLAKSGRPEEAVAHYQEALEANPNLPEVHYNLAFLLSNLGRTDQAVAHYEKALELNPNLGQAHNDLGILFAQQRRWNEALAHLQKASRIDPNDADVQSNLGLLLAKMGQGDEAISHFRRALEMDPNAIGALRNLAFALVQKGQSTDAASLLDKAMASARSAGDDARTRTIAQIIRQLNEAGNSSTPDANARAQ